MREILFRGKRVDNGEWVCSGNIFHLNENGGEYYIPNINTKCTTTHECNSIGEYGNISAIVCKNDTRLYKVNPETVGQYTGLTDKNGRKIFEGDICRMKADRLKGYGAIIFMGSAFVLCDKTHKKTRYYPLYPDGQFTVVGNIHDNPELLEVTE